MLEERIVGLSRWEGVSVADSVDRRPLRVVGNRRIDAKLFE